MKSPNPCRPGKGRGPFSFLPAESPPLRSPEAEKIEGIKTEFGCCKSIIHHCRGGSLRRSGLVVSALEGYK
jgi:hypothetical protein